MASPKHDRETVARSEDLEQGPAHAAGGPLPGDVVIRKESAPTGDRYTVGLFPTASQISCKTREAALTVAWGYARQNQRRVWEDDGGSVRLVPLPLPSDGRPRRKMIKAR
jgi:hypothetical protein